MKTGVVDVGGGLRGVYTAGVFDYCLDQDIRFDLGIGVSAGSAMLLPTLPDKRSETIPFIRSIPSERNI